MHLLPDRNEKLAENQKVFLLNVNVGGLDIVIICEFFFWYVDEHLNSW